MSTMSTKRNRTRTARAPEPRWRRSRRNDMKAAPVAELRARMTAAFDLLKPKHQRIAASTVISFASLALRR